MRNNTGVLQDVTGRPIRYGLCNESKEMNEKMKSSDFVGITTIMVTPEMVGQKVGVFTAIEMKKQGWKFNPNDKREVAQKAFIDFIILRGGFAGFANSPDDLLPIIKK